MPSVFRCRTRRCWRSSVVTGTGDEQAGRTPGRGATEGDGGPPGAPRGRCAGPTPVGRPPGLRPVRAGPAGGRSRRAPLGERGAAGERDQRGPAQRERAVHDPARPRRGTAPLDPLGHPYRMAEAGRGDQHRGRGGREPGLADAPGAAHPAGPRDPGPGADRRLDVQHPRQADHADLPRPTRRTDPGDRHPLRALLARPGQAVPAARPVPAADRHRPAGRSPGADRPGRAAGLHRNSGDRRGRPPQLRGVRPRPRTTCS